MTMKLPALSFAIAALAVAGVGCSANDDGGNNKAATEENAATTPGSAAGAADPKQAIVLVEGIYADKQTKATGVIFASSSGLALTANHVVEAAPSIIVTLADGTPRRGRVVARAQCHDLAVLRLTPAPTGVKEIPFGDTAALRPGSQVRTLSYAVTSSDSDEAQLTFSRGTVSALNVRQTFSPLPPMSSLIAHQTPLTPVGSGSPLLDDRGRLVGINTLVAHPRKGAIAGVEYALSSDYIRKRLRELKPGPAGTLGGWRSEHDACHHALNQLIAAGHTDGGAHKPAGGGATGGGTGGTTGGGTGGTTGGGTGGGTGHGTGGGHK